jgi:hypothetical protein
MKKFKIENIKRNNKNLIYYFFYCLKNKTQSKTIIRYVGDGLGILASLIGILSQYKSSRGGMAGVRKKREKMKLNLN